MAVLGIDFGQRRIGLALSEGFLTRPYLTLKNDKNFFRHLEEICTREGVKKIVIGLPEGKNQAKVKVFGEKIKKTVNLPTFFVSEVMSTREALTRLIQSGRSKKDRKKMLDASAAAIILESYLNQDQSRTKDEV
ncbi:hypothetical protein A2Z23_00360 [Candidatus Curtissbacteria bacterium RBG_16_39_7]|uniref:Putative pre-16S rRNA nuclease n=1 Tax=Candidatus Curtissbacteria bacterium RBG_16_39_7 TaxID=1797707 RepID=A0A1F5G3F6_9BACT|nr:MAG: hypothetical protein A2Z23_00360 [Candidatus Curtissbacteria bacterium RBG_16_39_7]